MSKLKLFVLTIWCIISAGNINSAPLIETRLEFIESPTGVFLDSPRFSWKIITQENNFLQKGFHIKLAKTKSDLINSKNLVWDSERICSSQSHLFPYSGNKLEPSQIYWWAVSVWDNNDSCYFSEPKKFVTCRDENTPWNASWIGINDSINIIVKDNRTQLPVRYLRKVFTLQDKPKKAILNISGLGSSYCYINGDNISDDIFGPLPSWYDASVPYLTYDVTENLKDGENAIAVELGNGRYFPMRIEGMESWGLPRLIATVTIENQDGSSIIINSDETWKVMSNGPIRSNNEYDGEIYDDSKDLGNWTESNYNDQEWQSADLMTPPLGKLVAQVSPSIIIQDIIRPVSVKKVGDSRYIVDMGQNMVGIERLKLNVFKNIPVKIRFAETLQKNDSSQLYVDNLRTALAEDIYYPESDGLIDWQPKFVYHGFRYMEISGVKEPPSISDIEGLIIYDKMSTIGKFHCSNEILNSLHKNAFWGIRGNYRGMPTDCPQRDERHGWLGDRTTGAYGESFLFDNALLYRKWLIDIEESMSPSGSISDVSPRYWTLHQDDVTWPAAYFYIADMLYNQFGDDFSIKERYESMKKWINHMIENHMEENIIVSDTYGDWCLPPESLELIHSNDPSRKTNGQLLSTAVFYSILKLMEDFAEINKSSKDKEFFSSLASKMKKAYNSKFYDCFNHCYDNNTVTANLISLQLGLVPEDDRKFVCEQAVKKTVEEFDCHVSVGVLGIQHLMRGLTENGYSDLAYKIATNETYPSWGYMIKKGATTIWELWNGDTADPSMNSGNHVMLLGDVLIWMYENLAGIKNHPDTKGFKKILMSPVFPEGLEFVDASYDTPYGMVESHWKRNNDFLEWEITVPANTTAELRVPAKFNLIPTIEEPSIEITKENNIWKAIIPSGSYCFKSQ